MSDRFADLDGYNIIKKFMIHGLYGTIDQDDLCTVKDRCTKHYLKKFYDETTIDQDGFAIYKRSPTRSFIELKGVHLHECRLVQSESYC